MNVREFREWLEQFDDNVEVEVVVQKPPDSFQSYGACHEVAFDGIEHYDYLDATTNQFITKDHPCYGRRILTLGESD